MKPKSRNRFEFSLSIFRRKANPLSSRSNVDFSWISKLKLPRPNGRGILNNASSELKSAEPACRTGRAEKGSASHDLTIGEFRVGGLNSWFISLLDVVSFIPQDLYALHQAADKPHTADKNVMKTRNLTAAKPSCGHNIKHSGIFHYEKHRRASKKIKEQTFILFRRVTTIRICFFCSYGVCLISSHQNGPAKKYKLLLSFLLPTVLYAFSAVFVAPVVYMAQTVPEPTIGTDALFASGTLAEGSVLAGSSSAVLMVTPTIIPSWMSQGRTTIYASNSGVFSKSTIQLDELAKNVPARQLQLIWPAQGQITQYPSGYHVALDIANNEMPPVIAAESGIVADAFCGDDGYGCRVYILHGNNLSTLYGHLSVVKTQAGAHVNKGEVIGNMGATGHATGIHLHFEVRKNYIPENPLVYLPNQAK